MQPKEATISFALHSLSSSVARSAVLEFSLPLHVLYMPICNKPALYMYMPELVSLLVQVKNLHCWSTHSLGSF